MPDIGVPNTFTTNNFKNIKMAPKKVAQAKFEETVGDQLNRVAGNNQNSGTKFVDKEKHNKMGKDEFLKLLTVQLQNQDPYKPVDQKKFAADLAQFASLEQLTGVKSNIEKLVTSETSSAKFQGASFLGKVAITSGTSLEHNENQQSDIPFFLPKNAKNVIIRVFDGKGQNVGQIDLENLNKGSNRASWNGIQMDGSYAPSGKYTVKVYAWDENMQNFNGETKTQGVVTGVHFEDGKTVLNIDNKRKVFLRDVDSFLMDKEKANNIKPSQEKAANIFAQNQKELN